MKMTTNYYTTTTAVQAVSTIPVHRQCGSHEAARAAGVGTRRWLYLMYKVIRHGWAVHAAFAEATAALIALQQYQYTEIVEVGTAFSYRLLLIIRSLRSLGRTLIM